MGFTANRRPRQRSMSCHGRSTHPRYGPLSSTRGPLFEHKSQSDHWVLLQLLRQTRVEQTDLDNRRLLAAHYIDQVDQQRWLLGEDAGEDLVVLGVEQVGGEDLWHAGGSGGMRTNSVFMIGVGTPIPNLKTTLAWRLLSQTAT
jgi:hypothetical protein